MRDKTCFKVIFGWFNDITVITCSQPSHKSLPSFFILYFTVILCEMDIIPLSQIWLMLIKLCLSPIYRTSFSLRIPGTSTMLFPTILVEFPSSKVTLPSCTSARWVNNDLSPVICLEQLLLRYHLEVFTTLNAVWMIRHLRSSFFTHTLLTLDWVRLYNLFLCLRFSFYTFWK